MGAAALLAGGQFHDRRPDERVAERQARGGLIGAHEAGAFGAFQALSPAVGGDRPDEAQITRPVQDGQEQQFVDRRGQRLDAGGEDRLQPTAQRQRGGKGSGDGTGQVAEGDGEFEQGERVTQGGVEQPPPHPRCHHGVAAGQQFCRRLFRQRLHARDGQVALVEEAGLACPARREEGHRKAGQAARHHAEHECAGAIQPRQVVDDEQQGLLRGGLLQQGQDRAGHEELRGRRPFAQAQGHVQSPGVQRAQVGQLGEARVEELVEGGEGDVGLELRAGRPQQPDPGAGGDAGGPIQQRGLSDARVARQQKRLPCSLGEPDDEQAQLLDLRLAADQFHRPGSRLIAACADPVHLPTFPCRLEHVQPAQCPDRKQRARGARPCPFGRSKSLPRTVLVLASRAGQPGWRPP